MKLLARLDLTPVELGAAEDPSFTWLAFSDDGTRLTCGRSPIDGTSEIVVIDPRTAAVLRRVPLDNHGEGAFLPRSRRLELFLHDLDVDDGEPVKRGRSPTRRRGGTGRVRIGAFEDGRIELVSDGRPQIVETHASYVDRVFVSHDDRRLLVSTDQVRLAIRTTSDGAERTRLAAPGWYADFCFSRFDREVLVAYAAHERRGVMVIDAESGVVRLDLTGGPGAATPYASAVAVDPRGGIVAVARAQHAETPLDVPPRAAWLELYAGDDQ
jgi:hypothetical protein